MIKQVKQFLLIGVSIGLGYFFASYHIIYFGDLYKFKLLRKIRYTFDYTFVDASSAKVTKALKIDLLRQGGLGDILVQMNVLTAEQRKQIEYEINNYP